MFCRNYIISQECCISLVPPHQVSTVIYEKETKLVYCIIGIQALTVLEILCCHLSFLHFILLRKGVSRYNHIYRLGCIVSKFYDFIIIGYLQFAKMDLLRLRAFYLGQLTSITIIK